MGSLARGIRSRAEHLGRSIASQLVISSLVLLCASGVQAAPFIGFDAAVAADGFSYGFVNPGSYGITQFRQMDDFYTAAPSGAPQAATSLLHVDPIDFQRCPRVSDNCSSNFHVFDVEWQVTFNADGLVDPASSYAVDLILVDSDPNPIFLDLVVEVDYASARLEGVAHQFETASYAEGAYYFIDAPLGNMTDGESKRFAFSYRVEGDLPLAGGGSVGFLFPTILPAATLPVPEPGSASMLGLGLFALALKRRRA